MLTSDVDSKKDPGLKPKPYLPSVNIILFHFSLECATRQTHGQIDSKSNRAIPFCPYHSLFHHPSHLEDLSRTNSSRLCPAWFYNQAFLACQKVRPTETSLDPALKQEDLLCIASSVQHGRILQGLKLQKT